MVGNMLGTVTALAGAFGAVTKQGLGRGFAVQAADTALVGDPLGGRFCFGLEGPAALPLLPIAKVISAKKQQVIQHRSHNQ